MSNVASTRERNSSDPADRLARERIGLGSTGRRDALQAQDRAGQTRPPQAGTLAIERQDPLRARPGNSVLRARALPLVPRHPGAFLLPESRAPFGGMGRAGWSSEGGAHVNNKPRRPVLLRIDGAGTEKRPYDRSRRFGRSERRRTVSLHVRQLINYTRSSRCQASAINFYNIFGLVFLRMIHRTI